MKLNELKKGQTALIKSVSTELNCTQRLMELGFSEETKVKAVIKGLTKGLTAYSTKSTLIALRDDTARCITINPILEDSDG